MVIQKTDSNGFGGLELVILEFHEWLIRNKIPNQVHTYSDAPLAEAFRQRGYQGSLRTSLRTSGSRGLYRLKKEYDHPENSWLFHRQQGLKNLLFASPKARVSVLNHTFYAHTKRDFFHRFRFQKAHNWIALSKLQQQNINEKFGIPLSKIAILPNGINLGLFSPKPDRDYEQKCWEEKIHIGIVARLDPQKGQTESIFALAELNNKHGNRFHLHLFGAPTPNEKSIRPDLESLAKKLGVYDHVHFYGHIENLAEQVPLMHIIWMPSYAETFARSILECMAMRLPIIATNAGGVPDVLTDHETAILVPPKVPSSFVLATEKLLTDINFAKTIATNARLDAESKYDASKIWPQLYALIRK